MDVAQAKTVIRRVLDQAKAFLAQESPPKLTEADTKANFIEPIIAALGWQGIGVVTREYYVRNSQEFVDYVMRGPDGPLLAIEAKALQVELTDKHAAQLIQYCSVEGIEWAALTNGRELQFFNNFLKPDLAAKRVLRLDLLAFNTDEEFDILFAQLWQLSYEQMTAPTGVRTWLNQRRLDTELRAMLLNPSSPIVAQIRKRLVSNEITATSQDLAQWFRRHLSSPLAAVPIAPHTSETTSLKQATPSMPLVADVSSSTHVTEPLSQDSNLFGSRRGAFLPLVNALRQRVDQNWPDTLWRDLKNYSAAETAGKTFLAIKPRIDKLLVGLCLPASTTDPLLIDNTGTPKPFNWSRITKVAMIAAEHDLDVGLLALIGTARECTMSLTEGAKYYGITLRDLVDSGLLAEGTPLVLRHHGTEAARAVVGPSGEIISNGRTHHSPSERVFAHLLGRQSLNGWTEWQAELPAGPRTLAELRQRLLDSRSDIGIQDGEGAA